MSRKREKFVELAEKRVNAAIKQLQLIGNLSNTGNYEFSESDYQKIFRAIETEVREMKRKFTESGAGSKGKFSLGGDN
ncbi:hypothetical protein [Erythrobacter sp. Alg231-14]|uniref:hypothetical protein n=1 Tax=Erythrobacter sp. Alg231-14 TaxID=1922225 RepID=UPI00307BEEA5